MGSIYDLKPRFQHLLHPVLDFLVRKRFTPNMITLIALCGSVLSGGLLFLARFHVQWLFVLPVWLPVRMALNALDGMLAREFHLTTDLGAVLNELGDVLADVALYGPLAWVEPASAGYVWAFTIGALLTEFCRVLGRSLGMGHHYEGPLGKSDRAFFIGALALLTACYPVIMRVWRWLFAISLLLLGWTCRNRIVGVLHECHQKHLEVL